MLAVASTHATCKEQEPYCPIGETLLNSDLIIGADNAALFTGLSRRTVYRLVHEGHIPAVRKGRRLYFRKSELERTFSTKEGIH